MPRLLYLLILLACLSPAWATGPVSLQLAVLEDAGKDLTLPQVLAADQQGLFRPFSRGFSAGYSRSAFWFRLAPSNATMPDSGLLEIQPPYLDDLRLYVPDASQAAGYRQLLGGDLQLLAEPGVQYRSTVFQLPAQAWENGPLYMRMETTSSSLLIATLWPEQDFHSAKRSEYAVLGLNYGLLLTLIMMLLWQGLWRRERLFRVFLLYAISMLGFLLGVNGLASQFILPNHPEVGHYWTQYSSFLMFACGAWFYRLVLQIGPDTPWLERIYRGILYTNLLLLPTPLLGWYVEGARLAVSLMLLLSVLGLLRGLRLWWGGEQSAGLLALAHGCALFGALSVAMALLGWLPGELWLVHGFQIGSLASILAFAQAMVGRMRDMEQQWRDEQIRAERYLQQSQLEADARRQQADFISLLSHEVRTPLAMIDGAVQSLKLLQPQANEQLQQRHGRIRRGVRRIEGLLEQFLQSERLDAPAFVLQHARQDLAVLCQQVIAAQSLEGRVHLELRAHHLEVDGPLLQIALGNLLGNAAKYAPAGSVITLQVTENGEAVEFRVCDSGPGIAEAHLPLIFDRFYRAPHSQGSHQGSGLGLYMVRRIAELHNGSVSAAACEGAGMCFMLRLPLRKELSK